MAFKNNPKFITVDGKNKMLKWVHQPLTFDHYDVHCKILENGKINLKKPVKGSDEYDEIEISASLVFKLVDLLKTTRKETYVDVSESEIKELLSTPTVE